MAECASEPVVTIRRATPADAARVLDLTRAANAEYAGRWRLSALTEDLAAVLSDFGSGHVLVACAEERLVGAVRCRLLDQETGFIQRLAVPPPWRRRGIATRLMRAAEGRLQATGARLIRLETVAENAPITGFYAALGYRIVETKPVPERGLTQHDWEKRLAKT